MEVFLVFLKGLCVTAWGYAGPILIAILAFLTIENLAEYFSVPQPVMAGTLAGTLVGALARGSRASKATIWVRLLNVVGGFFFALYATEGFVEILYHYLGIEPGVASHRFGGLILGVGGSFVVDLFFNFWLHMSDQGATFSQMLVGAARDSLRAVTFSLRNRERTSTVDPGESTTADGEPDHACPQP